MGKSCCIDIVKVALFLEEEKRVVALITSIIFGTTWLNLVIEPKLLYLFFFFLVSQISLEATIFLQLIKVVGHEW